MRDCISIHITQTRVHTSIKKMGARRSYSLVCCPKLFERRLVSFKCLLDFLKEINRHAYSHTHTHTHCIIIINVQLKIKTRERKKKCVHRRPRCRRTSIAHAQQKICWCFVMYRDEFGSETLLLEKRVWIWNNHRRRWILNCVLLLFDVCKCVEMLNRLNDELTEWMWTQPIVMCVCVSECIFFI